MVKKSTRDFKISNIIDRHKVVIDSLITNNIPEIQKLCEITLEKLASGGTTFFLGNGGSAADSQHLAAEFIGRFKGNRRPLPALALTTDTSAITAISNDFGYTHVFERQVSALCKASDIIICISTSGNSASIICAMEAARRNHVFTAGLLGKDGGKLAAIVDVPIIVSSWETARIQEAHVLIGHILCEFCDEYFAENY